MNAIQNLKVFLEKHIDNIRNINTGAPLIKANDSVAMENVKAIEHHVKEIQNLKNKGVEIPDREEADIARASGSMSDVAHHLDAAPRATSSQKLSKMIKKHISLKGG